MLTNVRGLPFLRHGRADWTYKNNVHANSMGATQTIKTFREQLFNIIWQLGRMSIFEHIDNRVHAPTSAYMEFFHVIAFICSVTILLNLNYFLVEVYTHIVCESSIVASMQPWSWETSVNCVYVYARQVTVGASDRQVSRGHGIMVLGQLTCKIPFHLRSYRSIVFE